MRNGELHRQVRAEAMAAAGAAEATAMPFDAPDFKSPSGDVQVDSSST